MRPTLWQKLHREAAVQLEADNYRPVGIEWRRFGRPPVHGNTTVFLSSVFFPFWTWRTFIVILIQPNVHNESRLELIEDPRLIGGDAERAAVIELDVLSWMFFRRFLFEFNDISVSVFPTH